MLSEKKQKIQKNAPGRLFQTNDYILYIKTEIYRIKTSLSSNMLYYINQLWKLGIKFWKLSHLFGFEHAFLHTNSQGPRYCQIYSTWHRNMAVIGHTFICLVRSLNCTHNFLLTITKEWHSVYFFNMLHLTTYLL